MNMLRQAPGPWKHFKSFMCIPRGINPCFHLFQSVPRGTLLSTRFLSSSNIDETNAVIQSSKFLDVWRLRFYRVNRNRSTLALKKRADQNGFLCRNDLQKLNEMVRSN